MKFSKQIPGFKLPATDLLPIHRRLLRNAWNSKWSSLLPNFTSWHTSISTSIPEPPWSQDLDLQRSTIVSFSRLRLGHNLLPTHSFLHSLNSSPLCTLKSFVTFIIFSSLVLLFLISPFNFSHNSLPKITTLLK